MEYFVWVTEVESGGNTELEDLSFRVPLSGKRNLLSGFTLAYDLFGFPIPYSLRPDFAVTCNL